MNFIAGLYVTTAFPFLADPVRGIYFQKSDGETDYNFVVRNANVESRFSLGEYDTSMHALAWHYDGAQTIKVYVNDALMLTIDLTNVPVGLISIGVGLQNNSAAARSLAVLADHELGESQ